MKRETTSSTVQKSFIPILILTCWWVLFISYFYLHEFVGHYSINWLSGISAEQMEIISVKFHDIKLLPIAITPINVTFPCISNFTGGFIAGLILLLLSIFLFWRLFKKERQEIYFWFFAITLGFSCVGFTESIFETFFLEYHRRILETVILSFFVFVFPLLVSVWHYRSYIKKYFNITATTS